MCTEFCKVASLKTEDNIKVDHMEGGWKGVDWIHVIQDKKW
jgi:hypothetical protein